MEIFWANSCQDWLFLLMARSLTASRSGLIERILSGTPNLAKLFLFLVGGWVEEKRIQSKLQVV